MPTQNIWINACRTWHYSLCKWILTWIYGKTIFCIISRSYSVEANTNILLTTVKFGCGNIILAIWLCRFQLFTGGTRRPAMLQSLQQDSIILQTKMVILLSSTCSRNILRLWNLSAMATALCPGKWRSIGWLGRFKLAGCNNFLFFCPGSLQPFPYFWMLWVLFCYESTIAFDLH